jgi:hypothetical protein
VRIFTYKNPSYYLNFGSNYVVLNVEVDITEEGPKIGHYQMLIKKAELNMDEEPFAAFLALKLSAESLLQVQFEIDRLLTIELQPQLFSLFYSSEPNATNTPSV